jgi:hypothetical protein
MSSPSKSGSYKASGGLLVALGASTVEQTGIVAGRTYEFQSTGGSALVRWGAADAVTADGGFDFAVCRNNPIRAVAPAGVTAVNIIEAEASSAATAVVLISEVEG